VCAHVCLSVCLCGGGRREGGLTSWSVIDLSRMFTFANWGHNLQSPNFTATLRTNEILRMTG